MNRLQRCASGGERLATRKVFTALIDRVNMYWLLHSHRIGRDLSSRTVMVALYVENTSELSGIQVAMMIWNKALVGGREPGR